MQTEHSKRISAAMKLYWKKRRAANTPLPKREIKARIKRRLAPERSLQLAVSEFLRAALPADAVWTSVPGGDRGVTLTPGYRSGWPDVQVFWRELRLALELKAPKGRASIAQMQTLTDLRAAGWVTAIVRDVRQVEQVLQDAGVPLRARVRA